MYRKDLENKGMATIEFVLVMPIILFLILILVQTTLLMAGRIYVNYAANAAVRSAITQIPREYSLTGEPVNVIHTMYSSRKFDAIQRSAWFAVMPVCGRDDTTKINTQAFEDGLRKYFELSGKVIPRWVDALAAERLAYAVEHTNVALLEINTAGTSATYRKITSCPYEYIPKAPVAVHISHRFYLSVPYVRSIFADDYQVTLHGNSAYADIETTAILTLEGVDPALPPEPILPRQN